MELIQTFEQAKEFIYGFANYEKKSNVLYNAENYDLIDFRDFLTGLGAPHKARRCLHIAGTKGKGGVAAFLSSLLEVHGFTTGLYTSPHLVDVRERIRLRGEAILEVDFIYWANQLSKAMCEKQIVKPRRYRTTFELLTAMAFLYFDDSKVNYSVLEVGMGGRLDCTNVVIPQISVLTPISRDHTESLGNTIEKIAFEKAGIIKYEIPVVSAKQTKPAEEVIQKVAQKQKAPLYWVDDIVRVKDLSIGDGGMLFSAKIGNAWIKNLFIRQYGIFHIENAALAMAVLKQMEMLGVLDVRESLIRQGLSRVKWHGRFSTINPGRWYPGNSPELLIADGAHNPAAARRLIESLSALFPNKLFTFVIAVPSNKDAKGIFRTMAPLAFKMIVTRYNNPRASDPQELKRMATEFIEDVAATDSLEAALRTAAVLSGPHSQVVVTGSLYLVGELYEMAGLSQKILNIF